MPAQPLVMYELALHTCQKQTATKTPLNTSLCLCCCNEKLIAATIWDFSNIYFTSICLGRHPRWKAYMQGYGLPERLLWCRVISLQMQYFQHTFSSNKKIVALDYCLGNTNWQRTWSGKLTATVYSKTHYQAFAIGLSIFRQCWK